MAKILDCIYINIQPMEKTTYKELQLASPV